MIVEHQQSDVKIRTYILGWSPIRFFAILLTAFLLPFSSIIHHFLKQGAYFLDSGWFAYLLSETNLSLANPPLLGASSYMATHISPSFLPFVYLSKLLGLTPHATLGLWQSVIFVLTALAGLLLIGRSNSSKTLKSGAWAFWTALLLPFSGLSLAILGYPHTEAMAMSCLFLCIALWCENSIWTQLVSWSVFVFALGVREDVGFHVFALFMTFLVLAKLSKQTPEIWQKLLVASMVGFIYSATAIFLQKKFFIGDDAFSRIYSGQPPWSHLSLSFVMNRLQDFIVKKPYLSLPTFVLIVVAIKKRQPIMLVPCLAYLPWIFVNLSAFSSAAGSLMGYYAYPLLSFFIWPLVLLRTGNERLPLDDRKNLTILCASMIILSIIGYRSSNGKRLILSMNPMNMSLMFDGSFERQQCVVNEFLKADTGSRIAGPQYGALFPSTLTRREVFIEPQEAAGKDYLLIWKGGYDEERLKTEEGMKDNYEPVYENKQFNLIWRKKDSKVSNISWPVVFNKCSELQNFHSLVLPRPTQ